MDFDNTDPKRKITPEEKLLIIENNLRPLLDRYDFSDESLEEKPVLHGMHLIITPLLGILRAETYGDLMDIYVLSYLRTVEFSA